MWNKNFKENCPENYPVHDNKYNINLPHSYKTREDLSISNGSVGPSDCVDPPTDSIEWPFYVVLPCSTEELNELIKVNELSILHTQLTTYSTETANKKCRNSELTPKVDIQYDPKCKYKSLYLCLCLCTLHTKTPQTSNSTYNTPTLHTNKSTPNLHTLYTLYLMTHILHSATQTLHPHTKLCILLTPYSLTLHTKQTVQTKTL